MVPATKLNDLREPRCLQAPSDGRAWSIPSSVGSIRAVFGHALMPTATLERSLAREISERAAESECRPDTKPRTTPIKVATGLDPHQRSSPNPITAGNEKPRATVVTLEAHSNPTATADRDSGCFSHGRLPLPRRRHRHSEPRSLRPTGQGDQREPGKPRTIGELRGRGRSICDQLYWAQSPCQPLRPQFEKFFTKSTRGEEWNRRSANGSGRSGGSNRSTAA